MKVLKDLVEKVKLFCGIEVAMADLLQEHDARLQTLESENKLRKVQVDTLKTQYSEMLMVLKDIRRGQQ